MEINEVDSKSLELLLACDGAMFDGLVLSSMSALTNISKEYSVILHIFDVGLSEENVQIIHQLVDKCHSKTTVKIYQINQDRFQGLRRLNNSLACYARLLAPELIKSPKVLYLDCDLYVGLDVSKLFSKNIDSPLAGVIDQNIPNVACTSKGEKLLYSGLGIELGHPYVNTGVLYMDLDELRTLGFVQWCLDIGRQKAELLSYYDQTLINAFSSMHGIALLTPEWNVPQYHWDKASCEYNHKCIIHFMGYYNGKPWTIMRSSASYVLARKLYGLIGYRLDKKRMQNKLKEERRKASIVLLGYLGMKYLFFIQKRAAVADALHATFKRFTIRCEDVNERSADIEAAVASWGNGA